MRSVSFAGHVGRENLAQHDLLQRSHQHLCTRQVLGAGIGVTGRLHDLSDA